MKTSESLLLDKFNQVLENNFHKADFGIEEICLELGTSRSQLYRIIKEQTQLSTSLYIRKRKLIKARQLLETSNLKTAEISYLLGIDSPQNFSKYFTQEFGVSPTAYRKEFVGNKNLAESNIPEEEIVSTGQIANEEIEERQSFAKPVSNRILSEHGTPKQGIFRSSNLPFVAAVFLSVLLIIYFWKPFEKDGYADSKIPAFSGNSIAIMPFKNLGAPQTAYYADGIMDQIHGSLALINKLKVISTTSSGKYKDSPKLAPQIARELDVNYILEGSVLQADKKLRINVELVRANDDRIVWTKSYDGDTRDVFGFLTSVAKEIASELNQKLTNATAEKLGKAPTNSPEAYNEYLKGCQLIISRKKEELLESITKLNKATEYDPEFAAAYAVLADSYYLLSESDFMDAKTSLQLSEQNSLTAIRLDAENGMAYANLANIYRSQNKWDQAKSAYEIALKYSPNDAQINYWYSLLLRTTGNLKEAIQYSSRAVALDPLHHVIFSGHMLNCIYAGQLDLVEKNIDDGRVLFNDSWTVHWTIAHYYGVKRDYETALKHLEKSARLNPGIKSVQYQTECYKALAGKTGGVKTYLDQLPDLPENYVPRAAIYASLGDKKKSLIYLQKAADIGIIPSDIKVSHLFKTLHNEPQYKAILKSFGL